MKRMLHLFFLSVFCLLPILALADVTMTALTTGQINGYIGDLGWAKFFGIGGAAIGSIITWIAAMRGLLGTPAGMAALDDAETILGAAADFIQKSGEASKHADLSKAVAVLNVGIQDAKNAAIPPAAPSSGTRAAAFLIGFLLLALAGSARATTLGFSVPLSPTAGGSYIETKIVVVPTMFKLVAGNLSLEPTVIVACQTTWQWGPDYGLGADLGVNIEGGIDGSNVPTNGKVTVGLVGNFEGYEVPLNIANDGWHAGLLVRW